jgi:hypothetical protein
MCGGGGIPIVSDVVDFVGDVGQGAIDAVSGVAEGVGDVVQDIGGGIESIVQSAGDALADVDDFVGDTIPGGWGTVAAVAIPYAAPYAIAGATGATVAASQLTALQAAALASGTSAITGAIRGESLEDVLKGAAIAGATSYGLSSLGGGAENIDLDAPYVDMADGANLLTPASATNSFDDAIRASADDIATNADELLYADEAIDFAAPSSNASNLDFDVDVPDVKAPVVDVPEINTAAVEAATPPSFEFNDSFTSPNPEIIKTPGIADFQIQAAGDSYLGALPTGTSDMPAGSIFNGDFGPEIVAPNGKTYLMRDLEEALAQSAVPADAGISPASLKTSTSAADDVVGALDAPNINDMGAGSTGYGEANELPILEKSADPFKTPRPSVIERASDSISGAYDSVTDYFKNTDIKDMPGDLYDNIMDNKLAYATGALGVAGLAGQGPLAGIGYKLGTAKMLGAPDLEKQAREKAENAARAARPRSASPREFSYGSPSSMADNYKLRNRINAGNVYTSAAGYTPVVRSAEGGEIKRYGIGGAISKGFTDVFQPIEKAVVRPIGDALPFLKDAAPYAGLIAAPFIANPVVAAGVGAAASGMGKGGFNMQRALMGGISAYGLSNIGAGIEAAGSITPAADIAGSVPEATNSLFRSPEALTEGLKNITAGGNSYDVAAKNFATKAGLPSGAMAVMGASGISAINEGIDQQKAADEQEAVADEAVIAQQAKIARQRQSAIDAVNKYPYQFAEGGEVDDNSGLNDAGYPVQGNLDNGMFYGNRVPGYADGGAVQYSPNDPSSGLGMLSKLLQGTGLGSMTPAKGFDFEGGGYGSGQPSPNLQRLNTDFDRPVPAGYPQSNAQVQIQQAGNPQPYYSSIGGGMGGALGSQLGASGSIGGQDNSNAFPLQGQYGIVKMAAGGMPPRFLSGGGDGMSDSIRASIDGTQEARLADGEFVIPADVVSHLGNGSSKAGAKQLYSMMDRVRKARTGNEKQGRQIKPKKFMPA